MWTALFAAAMTVASPAAHAEGTAAAIRSVTADEKRITISFDHGVGAARIFSLSGPDRLAIDMPGVRAGRIGLVDGPVTNVRQGQHRGDTARVVLDLAQPMVVTGAQFSADRQRLELDYRPAAGSELGRLEQLNQRSLGDEAPFAARPRRRPYSVSVPLSPPRPAPGLPPIAGPDDKSLPLVVLDAGHGGHDPGAISPHGQRREKDVTLAIARRVRDALLKSGRVRVALTRDRDQFLILQERYGIARKLGADLFLSIHADAAGSEDASGATVYTLSEVASDREAQRLAARENKADIINGVNLGGTEGDVSSILIDLTQRETMNVAAGFAKLLLREARPTMRLRSESHKFASFVVLKAPDTPSVLFEAGYLTNKQDVEFLASADGQAKVADAISAAIRTHFARRLAAR